MDEFSWFVGIFEGEGCFGSRICKKTYKDKVYNNGGIYLTIKMTDEDTIARCADFLGVTYNKVKSKHKQRYRVRVMGGKTGKLMDLWERMKPYLSLRRQEQLEHHRQRALSYGDTINNKSSRVAHFIPLTSS